jgi:hypothetical protein
MPCLVLCDAQPQWRHLLDLPSLPPHDGRALQWCLTGRARGGPVLDHHVRHRHQPQRLATVPHLPAGLLPPPAPQTFRLAHLTREPVARRRLAAVVTVLGQPRFQLLDPRLQHRVLRQHHLQLLALLAHETLEFRDPFLWRHAPMPA